MRRFLAAIQFLTIVPMGGLRVSGDELPKSAQAFPLAGLLQGAMLVALDILLRKLFPADAVSAIVIAALALLSGGFHLDGLSDTFDALAAQGDKDRKLQAMKDGRAGAAGASAIAIALLLKFASLKGLYGKELYYVFLLLLPALSKWAMVVSMFYGKPARREGLGKLFIDGAGQREILTATLIGLLAIAGSLYFAETLSLAKRVPGFLDSVAFIAIFMSALFAFGLLSTAFFKRKFGGLTGDTLGAAAEASEIIFLLSALVWSRFYTS